MFRSACRFSLDMLAHRPADADDDGELMPSDCCRQARGKTETAMAKNAAMKAGTSSSVATDGLELLDLLGSWHHCA